MANAGRKPKECKVCGSEFMPFQTTQKVCGFKCAAIAGKESAKKKADKAFRAETVRLKQGIKTHKQKLAEAQPIFNKLRRLQEFKWFKDNGFEPVCISCQKPLGGDEWCAGHLMTAGGHTNTRFDVLNVWLQHNVRCNKNLSGDIENYKLGLATRFGQAEADRIIEHCTIESKKTRTFTDEEFTAMRKAWRKEIRELEKELDI